MKRIKPPLPFVGHKGAWGLELAAIAQNIPSGCVVIDVFGGSGICAHYIKQARPDLFVVWNDFDNYRARLDHAPETEEIRRLFLDTFGPPAGKGNLVKPLDADQCAFVRETIRRSLAERGFIDLQTLSRWLYLYSHKTCILEASRNSKLYNRIPVVPLRLDACRSWLSDVVRTSVTFSGLDTPFNLFGVPVKLSDFAASRDVLLILDPPYLGTCSDDYGNKEALKILASVCECCERLPFLLFGDVSISFWYEQLFKGRAVRRYSKDFCNIGLGHKARTEVLFASMPWDDAQPLA